MPPLNIPQPTADTDDTGRAEDKPKRGSFIAYAFFVAIIFIVGEFVWANKAYQMGVASCESNKQVEINNAVAAWQDRYVVEKHSHDYDNHLKDSIINLKDSIISDKYKTIFDLVNVRQSGSTIKITR